MQKTHPPEPLDGDASNADKVVLVAEKITKRFPGTVGSTKWISPLQLASGKPSALVDWNNNLTSAYCSIAAIGRRVFLAK